MSRGFSRAEQDYLEPCESEEKVTHCIRCNEELSEGDRAYKTEDGEYFCDDMECVLNYYGIELQEVQEYSECENCGCRLLAGEMNYKTPDAEWICDDYSCVRELFGVESKEVELEEWD